jgi:hypothetical protein
MERGEFVCFLFLFQKISQLFNMTSTIFPNFRIFEVIPPRSVSIALFCRLSHIHHFYRSNTTITPNSQFFPSFSPQISIPSHPNPTFSPRLLQYYTFQVFHSNAQKKNPQTTQIIAFLPYSCQTKN